MKAVARATRVAAVLLLLLPLGPSPAAGQNPELEQSRRRIEEIRAERERLERQQGRLQGQIQDVSSELRNLERQRDATNRLINEIERQIGGLGSQMDRATAELVLTQDNLAERRAVLDRRLVDIYKRGPLWTWRVLLAAESFGDLLSRYKYLSLTSRQDRALLADVERLNSRISDQRTRLVSFRAQLDLRRNEREAEMRRYAALASEQARNLRRMRQTEQQTAAQITRLERDEARLAELLVTLERRAAGAGRGAGARPGTISTEDIGRLDWPVAGQILYRFGRDTLPSGGVIRWNGIGIGAPAGTSVKAVEAGRVALVQRLSTYGLTVVLEHGDGYFSLYMQLREATVAVGREVKKGDQVGTVGGENTDYGPHLHFEIRGRNQVALDPTDWLRRKPD